MLIEISLGLSFLCGVLLNLLIRKELRLRRKIHSSLELERDQFYYRNIKPLLSSVGLDKFLAELQNLGLLECNSEPSLITRDPDLCSTATAAAVFDAYLKKYANEGVDQMFPVAHAIWKRQDKWYKSDERVFCDAIHFATEHMTRGTANLITVIKGLKFCYDSRHYREDRNIITRAVKSFRVAIAMNFLSIPLPEDYKHKDDYLKAKKAKLQQLRSTLS